MLTGNLLRVRRQGELIVPRYLSATVRQRLLPTADALVAVVERARGQRRTQLEAAWDEVVHLPADRLIVAGLRKLLLDRCEFSLAEGPEPAELRAVLFETAAAERRQLGPRERWDRGHVMDRVAETLGLSRDVLEERLFADLRDNEKLAAFRTIDPAGLLQRYDLALAQAVLLRATRVVVTLEPQAPADLRRLFRAARFRGLLHRVVGADDRGYRIELDGPLSLFSQSKRYGLQLALFLPAVLRCDRWSVHADLLWGRGKQPMVFRLGPEQGLATSGSGSSQAGRQPRPTGARPRLASEVDALRERFARLESDWDVAPNEEIFALPDEAVCVPDLVFTHRQTGELVYLEVFGFWSRQAVWQRVETVARGFPARLILAVGKHLRVSEDVLSDDEAGQLYVYRTKMSARAILERLQRG